MQEENNGITFREICRTIWLRKWVALIVAVAVALICSVSLFYGYNSTVKSYEVEFSLKLPGDESGSFYSYPDGKQFHYADFISLETLSFVKGQSGFEKVDVNRMAEKGDIGIKRDVDVIVPATETTAAITEATYTVSAKSRYFDDKNQAKEFLTSVAKYPAEYLRNMNINYDVALTLAKNATGTGAINYLKTQLEFLTKEYGKLITAYGNTFVVDDEGENKGKTLLAYSQEAYAFLSELENAGVLTEADLKNACNTAEEITNSFIAANKAVYAKATSVVFVQPSVIVEKGGMGLTKILLLSAVIAVVVALIAAYVAGYYKLKALKAAKNSELQAPSDGEEAAVQEPSDEVSAANEENDKKNKE